MEVSDCLLYMCVLLISVVLSMLNESVLCLGSTDKFSSILIFHSDHPLGAYHPIYHI